MLIQQPEIRKTATHTFLVSLIKDDVSGTEKEIYFSVPNEYGEYLCNEVADAFVVAMLLPALVSGQDIKIGAPVSEMLYFQVENALTYIFSKVFSKKPVHIYPSSLAAPDFQPGAVATAFSGGVDSFATVLYHTSEECPQSLRLSHLTLFNVGAYGNKEETSEAFARDSERALSFSRQVNLPLVLLDSNISTMHNHPDIFYFSTRVVNNIMAGVLALQKLFKTYLLASGVPADYMKISPQHRDQGWYDVLLANFFSGAHTRLIVAGNLTRLEKIKYIAANPLAQKHLYVCQADVYNEKYGMGFTRDTSPNCSECDKCTRTLLALEILGFLNEFAHRFDLKKWENAKHKRLTHDLAHSKTDPFAREIIALARETRYPIPAKTVSAAMKVRARERLKKIQLLRTIYHLVRRRTKSV